MSSIFGGGKSSASKASVAATQADNAARRAFIERQSEQARGDALRLIPQGDQARNQSFQAALSLLGQGIRPQIDTFTQGNVGAQQVLNQGGNNFRNAILGLPTQQIAPRQINVDTGFLENAQVPQFQTQQPQQFNLANLLMNMRGV